MSMIKHLFAFALFFLAGTFAFGQNDSLPEDPSVYKDLPTYPYYPVNEKGGDLPDKVDFRAYCPKPSATAAALLARLATLWFGVALGLVCMSLWPELLAGAED